VGGIGLGGASSWGVDEEMAELKEEKQADGIKQQPTKANTGKNVRHTVSNNSP